ncbi:MAG TPA: PilC/PilY family type IV pilus protein, partial [Polyangiaceae bacterium LLY-WYZ-14_1]|nr:PilC/PilY family type IV pilus protein [Polyangiaceae bacterium LLY-WYZ-14_1]
SDFARDRQTRSPMVYVGANDGMLHGFYATTGEEAFAYVPNKLLDIREEKILGTEKVYPHANPVDQLATPLYTHKYFVDSTPVAEDVFIKPSDLAPRQWRTVLMGGLGAGGKGYYLVDVTDPGALFASESAATNAVLWEFTDADDTPPTEPDLIGELDPVGEPLKDLGFTLSEPTMALSNVDDATGTEKEWVGIFGNGYNSTSGMAKLFVLFLDHGRNGWDSPGEHDFVKISTGFGVPGPGEPNEGLPNGLGTPALVDVDNDGTVDLAYAGDLLGNLYRFDLRASDPSSWSATRIFRAVYDDGVTVTQQPITEQPTVLEHPDEGYLIVFGSGSFITEEDGVSTDIQSIYGIWDRLEATPLAVSGAPETFKATYLVEQTITNVVTDVGGELETLRIFSDNEVAWAPGSVQGWYIDLDMPRAATTLDGDPNPDLRGEPPPGPQFPGERAVRRFLFRNGNIITTTVIPRGADSCLVAPTGAVLIFDAFQGSNPERPFLDLQNDGVVDENDLIEVGGEEYAASVLYGIGDVGGQLTDPSVLRGPGDTDLLFISGSGAEGGADSLQDLTESADIEGITGPKTGRLSWRELDFNPN